jgi:outer membrane protein OmpA-like peptidoglycan-associated protein
MTSNKPIEWLAGVALVFVLIVITPWPAKPRASGKRPQTASAISPVRAAVPNGQQMKIIGIVIKRHADSFTFRDQTGVEREAALTPMTDVKTHRKGVFRGGKEYGVSYILRGLRLEVSGVGNAQGQLVADKVRFDEDDLRTAQALQSRVDPIEEETKRLARESEENAAAAKKAQATADEAMKSAALANDRINGLDDYDPVRTIIVPFATGKSTLGPRGKAEIDAAARWVKTQDRNGWVVAVVGFADSTGNTEANRQLSERRANAVIGYLVTNHNLPLQRLVQPFGYGENNPAAENTTAEGRAKNRRVEIRLLANRGIANVQ